MNYRKLRIAWSVAWGVVALLLLVLWVQSYYYAYSFERRSNAQLLQFMFFQGKWEVLQWHPPDDRYRVVILDDLSIGEGYRGMPAAQVESHLEYMKERGAFIWRRTPCSTAGSLPHWPAVLICLGLAASPWLARRFGRRNFLIATTLVAVVLGLIVWAD